MTLYEIQFQGHLDPRWRAIFEEFTIDHCQTPKGCYVTVMTGYVTDQSALYGLISHLRDLGVDLISVQPVIAGDTGRPSDDAA